MCGILGFLPVEGNPEDYLTMLQSSCELMNHRGPDDTGFYAKEDIIFAFKRLAIVDIEQSNQPLSWGPATEPDRYTLIFNGEIYNYLELRQELVNDYRAVFKTKGDSEVIPAAIHFWGTKALSKFRGMFAFALWDNKTSQLLLARDKFGIKPLFISETNQGLLFGSEKKSLLYCREILEQPNNLSSTSLQEYMEFQYPPETKTLHKEIKKLPSGSFTLIEKKKPLEITRYFYPNFTSKDIIKPDKYYFNKIAEALADSVAKHMRADVPVGSFLSGGIDSTAIAALAKEHNENLLTFTTGFPKEKYSEIEVAAESAHILGVRHFVNEVTMEDFMEHLPLIIWYLDDPIADPALVPLYFVAKNARKHVKVVLSGEGSDELFGGYTIYREPLSLQVFNKFPKKFTSMLANFSKILPTGVKGKSFLERGTTPLEDRYYGNARNFSTKELKLILTSYQAEYSHSQITKSFYEQSQEWDPVARMQYIDLFTWLNGDILVKADKMTMANSLELRVPFLDNQVLEIAQLLPTRLKISKETTKYALRMALREIVPSTIFNRPKLGFPVPIRVWLKESTFNHWVTQIITTANTQHLINKEYALHLLADHVQNKADNSRKIWTILIFNIWYSIFIDKSTVVTPPKTEYPVR